MIYYQYILYSAERSVKKEARLYEAFYIFSYQKVEENVTKALDCVVKDDDQGIKFCYALYNIILTLASASPQSKTNYFT